MRNSTWQLGEFLMQSTASTSVYVACLGTEGHLPWCSSWKYAACWVTACEKKKTQKTTNCLRQRVISQTHALLSKRKHANLAWVFLSFFRGFSETVQFSHVCSSFLTRRDSARVQLPWFLQDGHHLGGRKGRFISSRLLLNKAVWQIGGFTERRKIFPILPADVCYVATCCWVEADLHRELCKMTHKKRHETPLPLPLWRLLVRLGGEQPVT